VGRAWRHHIYDGFVDLSRIGGPKLSDQVAAQLQDRILQGELKPGDRLPTEAALGERLGVSRSVVRDAMRTSRRAAW
jgi:DNA-binding FadR family transcriptional regulator